MNRPLLATAMLGFLGASAFAQSLPSSNVTLSGNIDLGVARTNNEYQMLSASSGRSNLTFSGTEDLGGGMKAFFFMHHRFKPNDGTVAYGGNNAASQPFWRHLWVGLGGAYGDVRLGRMLVPHQDFNGGFEPWGTSTVASVHTGGNPFSVRSNGTIYYRSPQLGGLQLHASISAADNQGHPAPTGTRPVGLGLRYDAGAASLAVAADRDAGDLKTRAAYGKYDFGAVVGMFQYESIDLDRTTDARSKRWSLGANIPFGATTVKVGYRQVRDGGGDVATQTQRKIGLGLEYALSKRTFVYTDFGKLSGDALSTDQRSSMYDVGISHKF